MQADVLGVPVVVAEIAETTALGAAYLAGVGTGIWRIDQVRTSRRGCRRYEPALGEDRREALLRDWRRAVERSRAGAEA